MNGPALVVFRMATPGCSFQVPLSSGGRLMPVDQSIRVSKVLSNSTRRNAPVVSPTIGSANSCRPATRVSSTVRLLFQFQRPTRNGVSNVMLVWRSLLNSDTVSVGRLSPGHVEGVRRDPKVIPLGQTVRRTLVDLVVNIGTDDDVI